MENNLKKEELRAIIASVYYLESEARKVGLDEISHLFKRTIVDIDRWLTRQPVGEDFSYQDIVDSDLYNTLKLLERFSRKDKFDLQAIVRAIEHYDDVRKRSN